MIHRLEELTEPPVVGQIYRVPCVVVASNEGSGHPVGEWPVIGPRHTDAELIRFPHSHWHYDFRFLDEHQMRWLKERSADGPIHLRSVYSFALCKNIVSRSGRVYDNPPIASKPVLMNRACMRPALPFPFHIPRWLGELNDAHQDKRVNCGKCPHRGLPLSSLPREPGTDVVTCPGHGLRWDLKTGALVRLG